ncbi:MAG TPA: DUF5722 domain-containing protein, partial [Lacipirellulaceae bacterium]|nr:DUF5722 domain-containing protein [Lacipirellulaceae bacterium]
ALLACWLAGAMAPACAEEPRGDLPLAESFPVAASKKGLQVEDVADALALGVKHAAINVDLCRLVDLSEARSSPHGQGASGALRIHESYLRHLDERIAALSRHGVIVYAILLAYAGDEQTNRLMLAPQYAAEAPNGLGMFNVAAPDGRARTAALIEFLAERWSRPDRQYGRVDGYIVGNEVNSHWWWCNRGRVDCDEFIDDYLRAVRVVHDAVRSHSSSARVYVSLDHHWGIRYPAGDEQMACPGRRLVDEFARRARAQGDFDWHVAYHPYPENLFEPRYWNDATATPDDDAARITFKNLAVLTRYMRRPELQFHGAPRRIILSEQGFHTPDGPDGEALQAAAFCRAYKEIERLEGVDAFILHRHVDHPHEGGLRLGLRRFEPGADDPRPKKLIWDCFRAADQPDWEDAFRFALPYADLARWDGAAEPDR